MEPCQKSSAQCPCQVQHKTLSEDDGQVHVWLKETAPRPLKKQKDVQQLKFISVRIIAVPLYHIPRKPK